MNIARRLKVINISNKLKPQVEVMVCESFLQKLMGLMFQPELATTKGIILMGKKDDRINTSIHMFFMNFDIAVVWINSLNEVVDKIIAKKGHAYYAPKKPAMFTLELNTIRINDFNIGDRVEITNE